MRTLTVKKCAIMCSFLQHSGDPPPRLGVRPRFWLNYFTTARTHLTVRRDTALRSSGGCPHFCIIHTQASHGTVTRIVVGFTNVGHGLVGGTSTNTADNSRASKRAVPMSFTQTSPVIGTLLACVRPLSSAHSPSAIRACR